MRPISTHMYERPAAKKYSIHEARLALARGRVEHPPRVRPGRHLSLDGRDVVCREPARLDDHAVLPAGLGRAEREHRLPEVAEAALGEEQPQALGFVEDGLVDED